ncbi:MAG: lysophospholipid acyltransferase family protein [Succinivibrionaceae bacterium]
MLGIIKISATFLAYSIFFFGAITQGVLVYFLLLIFIRNKDKRKELLRGVVRLSFKFFIWLCSVLKVFHVHFNNFEKNNNECPKVIIANHPTLVDYVVLTSELSLKNNSMVKHSLTQGFMGPIIKHLGYISNQSPYEDIVKIFENKEDIVIFPEGTRTKDIDNLKFHRGAANIACRLKLNIYPIFVYCDTKDYLNKNFLSLKTPLRTPHIYVEVGEPIDINEYIIDNKNSLCARHLNVMLENLYKDKIKELKIKYGLYEF